MTSSPTQPGGGVRRYGHPRYSNGYECTSLFGERPDGEYVLASDYDALRANYQIAREAAAEAAAHAGDLARQRSAAIAEREGMRADAERYRSLRTELSGVQAFSREIEVLFTLPWKDGMQLKMNAEGLDAYIDELAAYQQPKEVV